MFSVPLSWNEGDFFGDKLESIAATLDLLDSRWRLGDLDFVATESTNRV